MIYLPTSYMELESIYSRTLGSEIRTMAVTSAVSGEGVSTLTSALARRVEASGRKVLLVELNLLNPQFGRRYRMNRNDWALNDSSSASAIVDHEGYQVLAAPVNPMAPMHFREQHLLQSRIDHWLKEYDVVLFDTSPLNALNQGNIPAEAVCKVCDGALLIVLAGVTCENKVLLAVDRLKEAGAKLLGAVINDQYNPTLANEMIRETTRLDKWLPGLSKKVRGWIRDNVFLNAPV